MVRSLQTGGKTFMSFGELLKSFRVDSRLVWNQRIDSQPWRARAWVRERARASHRLTEGVKVCEAGRIIPHKHSCGFSDSTCFFVGVVVNPLIRATGRRKWPRRARNVINVIGKLVLFVFFPFFSVRGKLRIWRRWCGDCSDVY